MRTTGDIDPTALLVSGSPAFRGLGRPLRRISFPALLLPVLLTALGGCTSTGPFSRPSDPSDPGGGAGITRWLESEADGGIRTHAQWRRPVASGVRVLEIHIENRTGSTLRFDRFKLGDTPWLQARPSRHGWEDREDLLWWQFYPSAEVQAGGSTVLALCFRERLRGVSRIRVAAGRTEFAPVALPPFHQHPHAIRSIAFHPGDGGLYIQTHAPQAVVQDLWVNGRQAADFIRLRDGRRGIAETLLVYPRPAFRTGDPVSVKVRFRDGHEVCALVRALPAMVRDVVFPGRDGRHLLGAEERPAVQMLRHGAGDVGCQDVRHGQPGASARGLIEERLSQRRGKGGETLEAIHYCVAMQTQTWDIYGALADAVYVNPYAFQRFGAGLFLEKEAYYIDRAALSVRPRPLLWMAEAHKHAGRYLRPEELRALFWTALSHGVRGVSFFAYDFQSRGLKENAELLAAARGIHALIERHQDILAVLLPVEHYESPDGRWRIGVAWGGRQGLLVTWRAAGELPEDADADGEHAQPILPVRLPEWFRFSRAVDLFTGETLLEDAAGFEPGRVVELNPRSSALGGGMWLESTKAP